MDRDHLTETSQRIPMLYMYNMDRCRRYIHHISIEQLLASQLKVLARLGTISGISEP